MVYPDDMFVAAKSDLDKILATAARMELVTELPLTDFKEDLHRSRISASCVRSVEEIYQSVALSKN